jgi:hypothetical protein
MSECYACGEKFPSMKLLQAHSVTSEACKKIIERFSKVADQPNEEDPVQKMLKMKSIDSADDIDEQALKEASIIWRDSVGNTKQ